MSTSSNTHVHDKKYIEDAIKIESVKIEKAEELEEYMNWMLSVAEPM